MVNRGKVALAGAAIVAAFALVWLFLPEAPAQASSPAFETQATPSEETNCLADASSVTEPALGHVPVDATLPSTQAVCDQLAGALALPATVDQAIDATGLAMR